MSSFTSSFSSPTSSGANTVRELQSPSSQELENNLSQITSICRSLTQLKEGFDTSSSAIQRDMVDMINKMRGLQQMIQIRGTTAVNMLSSLLSKNNTHFQCIKSIELLAQGYQDFISEIGRRQLYHQRFNDYLMRSQQTLIEMRNTEILHREQYLSRSGRYLPPFFHQVVPSLLMKPSIDQPESLPFISESELKDESRPKPFDDQELSNKKEENKDIDFLLRSLVESEEGKDAIFRNESLRQTLRLLLRDHEDSQHFRSSDESFSSVLKLEMENQQPDTPNSEINEAERLKNVITSESTIDTDQGTISFSREIQPQEAAQEGITTSEQRHPTPEVQISDPNQSHSTIESRHEVEIFHSQNSNEVSSAFMREQRHSPTTLDQDLSALLIPSQDAPHRYLYTLAEVAQDWSLFVENLYILIEHKILPVCPTSPNPQPDWFVCVTSHDELNTLRKLVQSQLLNVHSLISSFVTARLEFSEAEKLLSNPSVYQQISSDIISDLHFSSAPILFWEDSNYVPVVSRHLIVSKIQSFLFEIKIPLTEVSKVWKLAIPDLLHFIERGYLTYHVEEEETLIFEKSTGLSVYNPYPKKGKEDEMVGPFTRALLGSSICIDHQDRASPLFPSYTHTSTVLISPKSDGKEIDKSLMNPSLSSSLLSPLPSYRRSTRSSQWCITRMDMYTQPSHIQDTYLKPASLVCSIFGFDPSELFIFLTPMTSNATDCVRPVEWGVESFYITEELTNYFLKWKLVSLQDLFQMVQSSNDHREFNGEETVHPIDLREVIMSMKVSDQIIRRDDGERERREYFPVIDWEGEAYVHQSDSENIFHRLMKDQRVKAALTRRGEN